MHGNRGRASAHATAPEVRAQVVALASGKYEGVNHSHLAELLGEREGLRISRPTLRRILAEEGVPSPRPQRGRSKHRSRRECYPQEGILLQIDASHHHWFGKALPRVALLAVIDDATGKVPAAFFQPTEGALGYMTLLRRVVMKTGVPEAIYSDRHSTFWPTVGESLQEQLSGRRSPTQFGRRTSGDWDDLRPGLPVEEYEADRSTATARWRSCSAVHGSNRSSSTSSSRTRRHDRNGCRNGADQTA